MSVDMMFTGMSALLSIISLIIFVVILIKVVQNSGCLMGILGFFIPLVTYIWGWVKAKELGIGDLMLFWTFLIVLQIGLAVAGLVLGFAQNPESMQMMEELQRQGF